MKNNSLNPHQKQSLCWKPLKWAHLQVTCSRWGSTQSMWGSTLRLSGWFSQHQKNHSRPYFHFYLQRKSLPFLCPPTPCSFLVHSLPMSTREQVEPSGNSTSSVSQDQVDQERYIKVTAAIIVLTVISVALPVLYVWGLLSLASSLVPTIIPFIYVGTRLVVIPSAPFVFEFSPIATIIYFIVMVCVNVNEVHGFATSVGIYLVIYVSYVCKISMNVYLGEVDRFIRR